MLLTVVAALWPLPDRDLSDGVSTGSRALRDRTSVGNPFAAQQIGSLTPPRPAAQGEIVDLFARQSWTPPEAGAAPEKPVAPPLPFAYGGRYTEGGDTVVLLLEGAKMHKARQGDSIDATYRIESIAHASITLTYLPLGQQQVLQTGSPTPP
ncbi:MAG: hypothetical protein ACREUQ_02890 [Burkholderiales bacterium]